MQIWKSDNYMGIIIRKGMFKNEPSFLLHFDALFFLSPTLISFLKITREVNNKYRGGNNNHITSENEF